METVFKIFGWIFGALCITSAVLQYNDPDPLLWIVIYGAAALVSFAFALKKLSYSVPLVFGILLLLGCYFVFPEKFEGFEIGGGDIVNIERGREAIGLLILSLVMFVFALWIRIGAKSKV